MTNETFKRVKLGVVFFFVFVFPGILMLFVGIDRFTVSISWTLAAIAYVLLRVYESKMS